MFHKLTKLVPAVMLAMAVIAGAADVRADDDDDDYWEDRRPHHRVHHHHVHHRVVVPHWKRGWQHRPHRPAVRRVVVVDRHRPAHDRHHRRHGGGDFLNLGSAIGGVAGGILGNQIGSGSGRTLATVGGVIAGAVVGNAIYQGMQRADELRVARALETTPSGQTVSWRNPDTGAHYRVTPQPAFKSADRRDCRDYTTWAFVDGYERQLNGTACRTDDGRWQLVN